MNDLVSKGLKQAKNLTREQAKTFYFASGLLEGQKKQAAYAVYAICRLSDDSVDSPSSSRNNLELIESKINLSYSSNCLQEPVLIAFREVINKYKIPKEYFDQLIKGMYLDLEKSRYSNFEELYDYCYKVAGVVGLIMLQIFGYQDQKAKQFAVDLGIAMQLTNILRDVREDLEIDRIYLPQDEMQSFKLTEADLRLGRIDKKFIDFIEFQIKRARKYYQSAEKGIKMITSRRSRLVVSAMSRIYAGILRKIENNQYDLFSKRAQVSRLAKLGILTKIIIEGKYR